MEQKRTFYVFNTGSLSKHGVRQGWRGAGGEVVEGGMQGTVLRPRGPLFDCCFTSSKASIVLFPYFWLLL